VSDFVELWDPEREFFTLLGTQLAGVPYKGRDGVRRYCHARPQVWAELRHDAEELCAVDEQILAIGRLHGTGLGSSVELDHELALIFELRGRRVLRVRSYSDCTEAPQGAALAAP
jgi:hypothetical protein